MVYIPVTMDPEITIRFLILSITIPGILLFELTRFHSSEQTGFHFTPVIAIFGIYILINLTGVIFSINPGDGLYEASKSVLWFFTLILLFYFLKNNTDKIISIPRFITLAGAIITCIGLYQYIRYFNAIPDSGALKHIEDYVYSTMSNKNFLGETLLLILPFLIYTFFKSGTLPRILIATLGIASLGLILNVKSFNVYLAIGGSLLFTIIMVYSNRSRLFDADLFERKIKKYALISGFMVACLFLASVPVIKHYIITNQDKVTSKKVLAVHGYLKNPSSIFSSEKSQKENSIFDRLFLFRNSLKMIREYPVMGAGSANWKILMPKYGMSETKIMSIGHIRFEHPHNDYLFIVCENGILALLLWILIFVFSISSAVKTIRSDVSQEVKWLMITCISGLFIFSMLSLFSYPKERFFSMLLLITNIALIAIYGKRINPGNIKIRTTPAIFLIFIFSIPLSWIHFSRYQSEKMLYKALFYKKKDNFRQMQIYLEKAKSPFHILDLTGTPLSWHLGQACYYQNDQSSAFNYYLIASKQNPYHMQVLNDLGALYETNKNHTEALKCFNRVFEINPDFPDSKWNMAALYFNTGEVDKALEVVKEIKPRFTDKWRENMDIILLAKAEKHVQLNNDTILANRISLLLSKQPHLLLDQFLLSEKNNCSFEDQLNELLPKQTTY